VFATPLFAADWIQLIIFLLFVGGSAITQLIKSANEASQKKKQAAAKRAVVAPAKKKTPIDAELEVFLKKKPKQSVRSTEAPARASAKPVRAEVVRPRSVPPQQSPKPPRPPAPQRPAAEYETGGVRPGESVGKHVQRHLLEGGVAQRDPHLGDQVGLADERIESHLQHVFEHRLGNLADGSVSAPSIAQGTDASVWNVPGESGITLAAQVRAALSSPQQIGVAVVLSEILRRPEDRWS